MENQWFHPSDRHLIQRILKRLEIGGGFIQTCGIF